MTMSTNSHLNEARDLLAGLATEMTTPAPERLDVYLKPDDLRDAAQKLMTARWGYLSTITGLEDADGLEVLYHFPQQAAVVTLRVRLQDESPAVPSLCPVIPSAILMERELSEMFGITVIDIPDSSHLFLPDDWDDAVYPLRKDAPLDVYKGVEHDE